MFRVRNLVNTTGKTTRGVCEDLAKVEVSHSGRLRESSESVAPFFQLIHGAGKIYTGRRARPRGGNRHASVAMLGPWGQEGQDSFSASIHPGTLCDYLMPPRSLNSQLAQPKVRPGTRGGVLHRDGERGVRSKRICTWPRNNFVRSIEQWIHLWTGSQIELF